MINYDDLLKKYKPIDLMGWKVKNVNNFLFRNHPDYHPDTKEYYEYWINNMLYHSIEGKWVLDEDQWVWMYPKLFWYVNLGLIIDLDEEANVRKPIIPELRDTEWIIFTYLYCCAGFSGFENDMEFTCHRLIEQIEDNESLPKNKQHKIYDFKLKKLNKYVYLNNDPSTGKYKKYINAWDYLRIPKDNPLGGALYDNDTRDFVLLGSRGLGKSYTMSVGDLIHEFVTGGVKRWRDKHLIALNKPEIAVGSSQDDKLQEFLDKARYFYENMPGSYGVGKDRINSPFYRKVVGSWKVKQKSFIIHQYQDAAGNIKGSQSKIIPAVFTVQNPEAAVGIRPSRVYNEEWGLCSNAEAVYSANRNSLSIKGRKFGMAINIGTSGNMDKIREPKKMMTNPRAYEIYPLPNYWEAPKKEIGLFLPAYYSYDDFKDENGNTDLEECVKYILDLRHEMFISKAYTGLEYFKIYKPIVPSEMFMKSATNKFPQAELTEHLRWYENNNVFDKIAAVGELLWAPESRRGVKFRVDVTGKLKPIITYPAEDKNSIEGAVVIYEQPFENENGNISKGLYRVVYDPVRLDDRMALKKGVSLSSILVYKKFQTLDGMSDNIVAEYHGRFAKVNDIHELCLKFAQYYGAKITYENNLPGFKEYVRSENKIKFLEQSPKRTIDKVVHQKRGFADYGINMSNQFMKMEGDNQIIDWLKTNVRTVENEYGDEVIKTNLNYLMSRRLIEEMINYDPDENFDGISALRLMGLMRLDDLNKPKFETIKENKENEYSKWLKQEMLYVTKN